MKIQNKKLNKYILIIISIILFLLIFYFFINEYLKNKSEYFDNSLSPTYLFIYGNIEGNEKNKLKDLYKNEYKDNIGNIKINEMDIKNEEQLKKYNLPPKFEYEVRYYPKGINDLKNYESYYGKISDLKDIIIQKENSYNDMVSEEENKEADKALKSLM